MMFVLKERYKESTYRLAAMQDKYTTDINKAVRFTTIQMALLHKKDNEIVLNYYLIAGE